MRLRREEEIFERDRQAAQPWTEARMADNKT